MTLSAMLLAFSAVANAECASGTPPKANACFVGYFPHVSINSSTPGCVGKMESADACCSACASSGSDKCGAWEWIYPNASTPGTAGLCFTFGPTNIPGIKDPKHPMQTDCELGYYEPPPPPPPKPSAKIKNVLYILVDDLRTQLSPYGHSSMHTPNLKNLATSPGAVLFRQAYVQSQMCVPTRNSFMSGRRPDVTRVFNDGIGNKSFRDVGPHWTAMPQHFKESGWFTTGVGKTYHPNLPPNFDQPYSWSNTTNGFPYYYPTPFKCPPNASNVWCSIPSDAETEDAQILAEAKRRLGIISKLDRPFFLAVGFHKPHTPYRSPQQYFDLYPPADQLPVANQSKFPKDVTGLGWFQCLAENAAYPIAGPFQPYNKTVQQELRRAYYAAVSFTDDNIGKLLKALDDEGVADNTLVVFHADHGYQLGERNIWCKETNFNLAAHVPLIIRVPNATGSAETRELVEIVDIYPTLIDLAGAPPLDVSKKGEPPLGGKSLGPIVRAALGGTGAVNSSVTAVSQYARKRCYNDLFQAKTCQPDEQGHFIGFSVRRNADYNGVKGDGLRYTRWVNVTQEGNPFWDQVMGEELYLERFADGDDYDKSEIYGNWASDPAHASDLEEMRALLKQEILG